MRKAPKQSEKFVYSENTLHITAEMQTLIDKYVAWLKDKTSLRQIEDWIEITTPYLDRHSDYLQIYARRLNGGYLLTDDGYVLEDLQQSGCKIESPKRQALLKATLGGFGVRLNQNAMEVQASSENFPLRKHNLRLSPGLTRKKFVQPTHAPMRFSMIPTTQSSRASLMRSETTM